MRYNIDLDVLDEQTAAIGTLYRDPQVPEELVDGIVNFMCMIFEKLYDGEEVVLKRG